MKYLLLILLASCDNTPTGTVFKIAEKDGCVTYAVHIQFGNDTYYTKCDGRSSVSNTECHNYGKHFDCNSAATIEK